MMRRKKEEEEVRALMCKDMNKSKGFSFLAHSAPGSGSRLSTNVNNLNGPIPSLETFYSWWFFLAGLNQHFLYKRCDNCLALDDSVLYLSTEIGLQ